MDLRGCITAKWHGVLSSMHRASHHDTSSTLLPLPSPLSVRPQGILKRVRHLLRILRLRRNKHDDELEEVDSRPPLSSSTLIVPLRHCTQRWRCPSILTLCPHAPARTRLCLARAAVRQRGAASRTSDVQQRSRATPYPPRTCQVRRLPAPSAPSLGQTSLETALAFRLEKPLRTCHVEVWAVLQSQWAGAFTPPPFRGCRTRVGNLTPALTQLPLDDRGCSASHPLPIPTFGVPASSGRTCRATRRTSSPCAFTRTSNPTRSVAHASRRARQRRVARAEWLSRLSQTISLVLWRRAKRRAIRRIEATTSVRLRSRSALRSITLPNHPLPFLLHPSPDRRPTTCSSRSSRRCACNRPP